MTVGELKALLAGEDDSNLVAIPKGLLFGGGYSRTVYRSPDEAKSVDLFQYGGGYVSHPMDVIDQPPVTLFILERGRE